MELERVCGATVPKEASEASHHPTLMEERQRPHCDTRLNPTTTTTASVRPKYYNSNSDGKKRAASSIPTQGEEPQRPHFDPESTTSTTNFRINNSARRSNSDEWKKASAASHTIMSPRGSGAPTALPYHRHVPRASQRSTPITPPPLVRNQTQTRAANEREAQDERVCGARVSKTIASHTIMSPRGSGAATVLQYQRHVPPALQGSTPITPPPLVRDQTQTLTPDEREAKKKKEKKYFFNLGDRVEMH